MNNLDQQIDKLRQEMIALRRELHKHSEVAFKEVETSRRIADTLKSYGLEVRTGVGKTGVVGLLKGGVPGKTIAVRADMDALPITEGNATDYTSLNPGVMHACGHDGHMAVALTLARVLSQHKQDLKGNIKFIFQPAEEIVGGARPMIQDGVLENPKVDAVLGFHLWNHLPVGTIGVREGPIFAAVDIVNITIKGKGGHGAMPHLAVDAVNVAAHVLVTLQSLLSREKDPSEPVSLTFGTIHGGTALNVIADEVKITGTMRTLNKDVRDQMVSRMDGILKGITQGMRGDYSLEALYACPPVVNHPEITALIKSCSADVVGEDRVVAPEPILVADDMSLFLEKVPGCYFLAGSGNASKKLDAPHHSPHFDFDEDALVVAAKVLGRAVLRFLS